MSINNKTLSHFISNLTGYRGKNRRYSISLVLIYVIFLSFLSCQFSGDTGETDSRSITPSTSTEQGKATIFYQDATFIGTLDETEQAEQDQDFISSLPLPTLQSRYPWLGEIRDGGLLSGEPCGPPCFWGVIPGTTTEGQLYQIFEMRGMKENCVPYDREKRGGVRGIDCLRRVGFSFVHQTDMVEDLGFEPSKRIFVQDVIEKYGDPDHVWVSNRGSTAEYVPIAVVFIFYDRFHMWIDLIEITGWEYSIDAFTPIASVNYGTKEVYDRFRDQFEPWQGYGLYDCKSCLP